MGDLPLLQQGFVIMVSKMRSKKTLKELLKLDLETIEAMAPNPFRFTRIDVVVSLRDPEYCKVNRAAIKATKRSYCKEDRAILKRFSKALKMHYSLGKACTKENQGKRMLNKKNAASSPSIGSILASTSHSTGSTLASTSTTKTDIPKLLEIFKAIIASLKGFDVETPLLDPEYYKVNQAAIKDRAVLEKLSKVLKLHHSLRKKRMKENQGKRMPNKKNAASSPSIGSTLASTSPSIGSTLSSTSTTKIDIPELLEIFKAIIASLKGFDVTFVMQRKLTKTDLEPNNIQLAMPEKQINEECKFLAHKDAMIVRILEARDGKGQLIGMKVGLIEPSGEVCHDQIML
ncbi:hypothetical protein Ahy_B07g087328 [Arachis hypogaea]|uniref:Uncharacterized protein n=1 Tax=Arachis hypogaea TaxID=3818 RepID=A0A444YBS7_ARAHY|nr:hypothetical protein Ahy_B07g087328 [Arachis hypogaea]